MPFDSLVMSAVLKEIRNQAREGQVTKIFQPSSDAVNLHLRAGGSRLQLLFSVDPHRFRIHFVREAPANPPTPPQYCMVLRKHLEGAKLESVEQNGLERVARFRFERSDGVRFLVAEMMGKHSNLILLDDRDRILDSLKHVSGRINRVRELLPNRPYLPPPAPSKPDPLLCDERELADTLLTLGDKVGPQEIVKVMANVGPFLAREVLARAESDEPLRVASALHTLMDRVRRGAFAPALLQDEDGNPGDAWSFECRSVPDERQDAAPEMSLALEIVSRMTARKNDTKGLRSEVRERLQDLIGRGERRLQEMGDALARAENADELRIRGEVLQAHTHLVEKGQTEALLPNFYDPNLTPLLIELDPLLSPQENVEALFRRHRKAKDSIPHLQERLSNEEEHLNRWRSQLTDLETWTQEQVEALHRELEPASQTESSRTNDVKSEPRRPAPGVRRTESSDGYEIWYGEHKEGNDTLTTKLAAPTDLWFHVRAGASAHVVIRTRKSPEKVPHRTLIEAARIAAAHSESKHSKVIPVDFTQKKYVRKPRGSGPGQALYTHEKTLHVDQE